MRNVPSLETVYRDYSKKGVCFYYVYKSLAHPGMNGYVQPLTKEERLTHVQEAKKQLQTEMPWIADTMTNEIKLGFTSRNNSEFVIDPDGKFVHARTWSDPKQLREDLATLVGEVTPVTTVSDLKWKTPPRPSKLAPSGIVTPVPKPSDASTLKCRPTGNSASPYYVKLRVEAERSVIEKGTGKLHLAFHLDPIHHVHWNNLAPPIRFEIKPPTLGTVEPSKGEGPKLKEEADMDQREFLLEVDNLTTDVPLELTVHYFACHDEEGWCKAVSQTYEIRLERDPDADFVRDTRRDRGNPPPGLDPRRMMRFLPMTRTLDPDDDGEISAEEIANASSLLLKLDEDGDGTLSGRELRPSGPPPFRGLR